MFTKILSLFIVSILFYTVEGKVGGILPSPSGPFYGVPFNGSVLLNYIPFTLTGNCKANESYVITKISDLAQNLYNLECIYAGSRIPEKIPQGSLYATCLTIMNSPVLNPLVEAIWEGKYIKEVVCNGEDTIVGWNAFFNGPTMPFIPIIGKHNLNVAPAEDDDGRGGLVVQYSNDVMAICPELREKILKKVGTGGVSGSNVWSKNIPFMDVIRFVGKQEDGGNIYLLKTYLRDAFRPDRMAITSAFTAILNYDEYAEPDAVHGMSTLPLLKDHNYMFPGLNDMIQRGLPFDNLFYTPGQTLGQLRKEGAATRKNVWRFLRDLPFSYRRIFKNGWAWIREYRNIEVQRRPNKSGDAFQSTAT